MRQILTTILVGVLAVGSVRADDAELRTLIEQMKRQIDEQQKQLEEQKSKMEEMKQRLDAAAPSTELPMPKKESVDKIVKDYLHDHPGAGMPPGVQCGFDHSKGFFLRSPDGPKFVNNLDDKQKIPFEMRFHGRIQVPYYYYDVTSNKNHFTGIEKSGPVAPDFSSIEVKRARLIWEGEVFTPELHYHFQLDGSTRGISGLTTRQGVFDVAPTGANQPGDSEVNVNHVVRLLDAWIGYDFHPCKCRRPEGAYCPTFSIMIGKMKMLFGLEEYLGSATCQFVEYSMADWFFDADDDNYMTGISLRLKALEDRYFGMVSVTNGNETQIPNLALDHMPGLIISGWYDLGGTWDSEKNRWLLFGDSLSDLEHHCDPVLRLGGGVNFVPMDRRSLYTNAELNRVRVVPGIPNSGGSLLNVLNGNGIGPNEFGNSTFAADAFDSYTYNIFGAAKYRGLSFYNEWWLRNVNHFRGELIDGTNNPILYASNNLEGVRTPAVMPPGIGIVDYGTTVQMGYFLVPKKFEIAGRFSYIAGQSGNINGDGTFTATTAGALGLRGVPPDTVIYVMNNAFRRFQDAEEYAISFNYFWKGQQLKWQTDFSFYTGGNPAANGQSPAGFIPGADGFMVRSQIQLAF